MPINRTAPMNGQLPSRACVIYARVSTDDQKCENQLQCINRYIDEHHLFEMGTCTDVQSTAQHWTKRGIAGLIQTSAPGTKIVVSEVSRLARNTLECLEIFKAAAESNLTIIAVKNGLVMDGSTASKIVSTVLAMAAEIERDMIRARTVEALARRKAAGLPMGRPKGSKSGSKLEPKKKQIINMLNLNVSKTSIARMLNCSRTTLNNAITDWKLEP